MISTLQGFPNCKGVAFAGQAYVIANATGANAQNPSASYLPTYTLTFLNTHQTDVANLSVYRATDVSDVDPGAWQPVPTRVDPATASLMGGKPSATTAWGAFAIGRTYTYS